MGLEDKLEALKLAMSDIEPSGDLLERRGVSTILAKYFVERDEHKKVTSQINIPTMMLAYLSLSKDQKEELDKFNNKNPGVLRGNKTAHHLRAIHDEDLRKFAHKQRLVSQVTGMFQYFVDHREDYQLFDSGYLLNDKKFLRKFKSQGRQVLANAKRHVNGDFARVIERASEIVPEITEYTDKVKVHEIDGTKNIIEYFDFFKENRTENQAFNLQYLAEDSKFKEAFGKKGRNSYHKARIAFIEGGFDHLVELASKERPEIKEYRFMEVKEKVEEEVPQVVEVETKLDKKPARKPRKTKGTTTKVPKAKTQEYLSLTDVLNEIPRLEDNETLSIRQPERGQYTLDVILDSKPARKTGIKKPSKGTRYKSKAKTEITDSYIDIEIRPGDFTHGILQVTPETNGFFGGYEVQFMLETDVQTYVMHQTGGSKDSKRGSGDGSFLGHPDGKRIKSKKLKAVPDATNNKKGTFKTFYRAHPELKAGDVIRIEKLKKGHYKIV
jgi:hypothetical protein